MRFSTFSRSISDSISSIRCSTRSFAVRTSRTSCFSSSLSERCAAIVSDRREASSIFEMVDNTSLGTFLDSCTYCSKCPVSERSNTSFSRSLKGSSSITVISPRYISPASVRPSRCARTSPSTRTFTVPSGSLSNCRIVAMVPVSCIPSRTGASSAASR